VLDRFPIARGENPHKGKVYGELWDSGIGE